MFWDFVGRVARASVEIARLTLFIGAVAIVVVVIYALGTDPKQGSFNWSLNEAAINSVVVGDTLTREYYKTIRPGMKKWERSIRDEARKRQGLPSVPEWRNRWEDLKDAVKIRVERW
jgi:hypothetical protein